MGQKRRRTPQEKKAHAYAKDTRGHFDDSPNVKFSRKLDPLRDAQETRRRRRVFNARTSKLGEMAMDEEFDAAIADTEAGELEQDLGRLGKRGQSSYGPWTLREHVDRLDRNRETRRIHNASWQWVECPSCGRRHKEYVGPPED